MLESHATVLHTQNIANTDLDMVNDMEVDKVADIVADIDINIDMEI